MPQLDQIDTYLSQVFWTALCFGILWIVMWKVTLPRIAMALEQRQSRLDDDLERAAQVKTEADTVREGYEKALADAHAEGQAAIRKQIAEMNEASAQRHAELTAALAKRIKEAEVTIATEKTRAMESVREVAVETASAATERLVGVSVDAESARKAVDAALSKTGTEAGD